MLKPDLYPNSPGDFELLVQLKTGNPLAFDTLYKKYWATAVNTAYKRVGCQQKAQDLVQDVFTAIYHRRCTLDITTSFAAYLHQALKYRILNDIRQTLVQHRYINNSFFTPQCKNDLVEVIEGKELNNKIERTINHLPEKCREVFLLSRHKQQPYKQISLHLNISVSTVEKHMVKALRILRANCSDRT